MHRIYPIGKDSCQPYIGKRVCAVLADGTHIVGTISAVTDQGLEFGGTTPDVTVLSKKGKAKTKAYGYPGYGYPGYGYPGYGYNPFVLDWVLITLLFLLPFI